MSFGKVNLILIQTMLTVILEDDKVCKNCGGFVEVVQYTLYRSGCESRLIPCNFSLT